MFKHIRLHVTKIIWIFTWTITLQASQYGPGLLFHKPYSTTPYQSNFYTSFTAGQTNQAYNEQGQIVPYLQEYGTEDLLKKFIDHTLPQTDIETIGTITFGGTFHFQQMNLTYTKNIHNDLFIGMATSIRNLSIKNISSDITLTTDLNPQEIFNLEVFESKLPKMLNKSGIFATVIEVGYNKMFTDFDTIDFLHIFFKGDISAPQWMTGERVAALQYPIAGNLSMSYPLTAIISCDIADHVTLGVYGMCIPIQSIDKILPVNTTSSNNQIILTDSVRVKILPKPLFSAVGYMEVYNFIPKLVTTVGYGYAYGMPWKLKSFDEANYPTPAINNSSILHAWNITSMFFQLDYRFPSKTNPQTMNLSLFCVIPLTGNLYPQIHVFGGNYALLFSYNF